MCEYLISIHTIKKPVRTKAGHFNGLLLLPMLKKAAGSCSSVLWSIKSRSSSSQLKTSKQDPLPLDSPRTGCSSYHWSLALIKLFAELPQEAKPPPGREAQSCCGSTGCRRRKWKRKRKEGLLSVPLLPNTTASSPLPAARLPSPPDQDGPDSPCRHVVNSRLHWAD